MSVTPRVQLGPVSVAIEDADAVITIDSPPLNRLSHGVRKALLDAVQQASAMTWPPGQGRHTEEVLSEMLGQSMAEIEKRRQANAI